MNQALISNSVQRPLNRWITCAKGDSNSSRCRLSSTDGAESDPENASEHSSGSQMRERLRCSMWSRASSDPELKADLLEAAQCRRSRWLSFPKLVKVALDGAQALPLITSLFWKLVGWLGCGMTAYIMGLRLLLFAMLILPACIHAAVFWLFHPSIIKGVRFGPKPRNFLDIYIPPSASKGVDKTLHPVVVNVMGGAWIIGYRAWSAWMGKRLALEQGFIFVAVDYRNFPQAQMSDMVDDVALSLDWIFRHIENYGGDPRNVSLLGQSAGAQLSGLVLLERCLAESANPEIADRWSARDIKRFVGISGPYNLEKISTHLAKRGLKPEILRYICDDDLEVCSPTLRVSQPDWLENLRAQKLMPPITLIHGTADKTVPQESTVEFAATLKLASGVEEVDVILLEDVTHSEPIVEGPIRGRDPLMKVLMPLLGVVEDKASTEPLQPQWLTNIASKVMPF